MASQVMQNQKMLEIAKLVPRIKFSVKRRHRNLKDISGPMGRINKLRSTVTALLKHERIEVKLHRCDEARGYAERLICEAIRHGDKHPPTMEMADFWLEDKQMIHKLFKVLAPRYEKYQTSVTDMHLVPMRCHLAAVAADVGEYFQQLCVLELKGNPYPSMPQKPKPNSASLANILLKEASKEFRKMKLNSENAKEKN